jgi:hypothetical protein
MYICPLYGTKSRVITRLLTGHLPLMGLNNSPLSRRCGTQDET